MDGYGYGCAIGKWELEYTEEGTDTQLQSIQNKSNNKFELTGRIFQNQIKAAGIRLG